MAHQKIRFTKSAENAQANHNNENENNSLNYPNYELLFQSASQLEEAASSTEEDNNHLRLSKAKNWDSLKVPERTQSMRQTKSNTRPSGYTMQRTYTTRASSNRSPSPRDTSLQRSFRAPRSSSARSGSEANPVNDEDLMRLRTFAIDPKAGFINRGDSFRSKSAMSNSESVPCFNGSNSSSAVSSRSHSPLPVEQLNVSKFDVFVIGSEGVGKTVLINQFKTSDYCNLFNTDSADSAESGETTVSVLLDGEESELKFIECDNEKNSKWKEIGVSGYLIVYSVDKDSSFKNAIHVISELRNRSNSRDFRKPIVLVGNKVDLERRRYVSKEDAKSAAKHHECKFVETSVAIGHNVDKLLAGILTQVRRKRQNFNSDSEQHQGKTKKSEKLKLKATRSSATTNVSNFTAAKTQLINRLSFKKTKSVEDLFSNS